MNSLEAALVMKKSDSLFLCSSINNMLMNKCLLRLKMNKRLLSLKLYSNNSHPTVQRCELFARNSARVTYFSQI